MMPVSELLKILIPIKKSDLKIFIPFACLIFFIIFNYICIHAINDTLIVPNIGAEILPYLDFFGVLPFAIIFSMFYIKFCNIIGTYKLFHLTFISYALFYLLYVYVIFPNEDFLHPNPNTIAELIGLYPAAKWIILAYGKYTYSIFHIVSEMWPTICVVVIFWQFANSVIKRDQAKRLYPLFIMVGNVGLVSAGVCIKMVAHNSYLPTENHPIVAHLTKIVIAICFICVLIHYVASKHVIKKDLTLPKVKYRMSLRESLKTIYSSRYLMAIFGFVLCYGISVNILQNTWKAELRKTYPATEDFAYYYGLYNQWLGIASISFMCVGAFLIRNLKWKTIAMVPVLFTFLFSALFYFIMFVENTFHIEFLFSIKTFALATVAGGLSYIFSKASKYSFFDISKEMAYIPLEDEIKTKGKAAIDAVSERLGKGLGAFFQAAIFFAIPSCTYQNLGGVFLLLHIGLCYYWYTSINRLDREMEKAKASGKIH